MRDNNKIMMKMIMIVKVIIITIVIILLYIRKRTFIHRNHHVDIKY